VKRTVVYSWTILFLFIMFWEGAVRAGNIRELILPPPSSIMINLWQNVMNGYLIPHIAASLIEILGGFLLGSAIGIALGCAVAQSNIVKDVLRPYIIASQAVPKLALAPLFIMWFGYGLTPKIVITALICFFPLFESTVAGLSYVDEEKITLFRSMRATPGQIFMKLRLPTAVPYIFAGLRVSVVLSVVGAVVSEFIGASQGLGALIIAAQGMMETPLIFSVIIVLTVVSMVLYSFIQWAERRFFKKYLNMRSNS
jgi:NitT/TauT family transport system permease protein